MKLSTFDLNLLRTLDMLLQEGSVTRAAERLHVTQQAMSGTLKRLREQFGDELLVQVGRRLEPTPLGSALLGPVHEVMLQIARTVDTKPTFDAMSSTRKFRLAISDYASLIVAPLMLAELSQSAPRISFDYSLLNPTMPQDLEIGTLDFAFYPGNWPLYHENVPDGLISETLFEDDFVCVVDKHSNLGETISVAEYASLPHCAAKIGGGIRTLVDNAWIVSGIAPRVAATSPSFVNLLPLVAGTPTIATVPRRLVKQLEGCWPLRTLECPIPVDRMVQQLNWHERNINDPAHRFVRETFVRICRERGLSSTGAENLPKAVDRIDARATQGPTHSRASTPFGEPPLAHGSIISPGPNETASRQICATVSR